jgi:hypothetical protein
MAEASGRSLPSSGTKPRKAGELEAAPRPPELEKYVGQWVAIKGGRVVASAQTAVGLVDEVKALGDEGIDAVVEYVSPPSSSWMVGVG